MVPASARDGHRDLAALPLHPLLAAAYPVVFVFAVNAGEHLTTAPLWPPLLASVAGATVVFAVLRLALRDSQRAALVTTVLVIGFFGYGHAWNAASTVLDAQWPLIAGWLALIAGGVAAALMVRGPIVTVTRALNFVGAVLVLLNAWGVASVMVALGASEGGPVELTTLDLAPSDADRLPDVYYIVPDRYAGATTLRERYGFDNEPFLAALEERGFSVARRAHANYIKTPLSLVSSLSLDLLDADALRAEAANGRDREPVYRRLREHLPVPAALKELGYRYVHLSNWWTPTATNVDADITIRFEGQDEFTSVLAQTTLLRALSEPDAAPDDPWDRASLRENNLYALDRLDELPEVAGPKFVFAHLLTTHPPYVHDTDGSFPGAAEVAARGEDESYRRQLSYANARLLGVVDRILASAPDAVILLQADEGPFPSRYTDRQWEFDWTDASDSELEQKFGILLAMRVPGADLEAEGFHDALTPVNAFRIIFNARFGTDLALLPDRTWSHVSNNRFYDFFEITDRLRR